MLGKMPNLNAKCYLENSKLILFHKDFSRTLPRSTGGIPFTPAGYGTEVAEGKEVREFNGKMHIMEHADFAIVKSMEGDEAGNLVFKGRLETSIHVWLEQQNYHCRS
jgi:hypothetical protein